jgi:hypothetical protein
LIFSWSNSTAVAKVSIMAIEGFWSYVHADDDAEGGRITRLARDLTDQYELLTGESISLFLDRDSLEWGDDWEGKIDASLGSLAFFIPVLTPRYFLSPQCRRELNSFIRSADRLGLTELLMPILYAEVPGLAADSHPDDLMALVRRFQWQDWRDLRFADPESSEYRRSVADLATRLMNANRATEETPRASAPSEGPPDDDEPGTLDKLARAIEAMSEWSNTLSQISEQINVIRTYNERATRSINKASPQNELAVRIRALRQLAGDLNAPVGEIERLSQDWVRQLYDVDSGVRIVISGAALEATQSEENHTAVCEFYSTVRGFAETATDALDSTKEMVDSAAAIETLSRDIRPVMRSLRKALTGLIEGRSVIQTWVTQIDESGVDCE